MNVQVVYEVRKRKARQLGERKFRKRHLHAIRRTVYDHDDSLKHVSQKFEKILITHAYIIQKITDHPQKKVTRRSHKLYLAKCPSHHALSTSHMQRDSHLDVHDQR